MELLETFILLDIIFIFLLGIFVILRAKDKNKIAFIFTSFCFSLGFWVLANFLLIISPSSTFYLKSTYAFGALSASVGVVWALAVCKEKINPKKIIFIISLGVIFFILSYTNISIPSRYTEQIENIYVTGIEIESNKLFFTFYFSFLIGYFTYLLYILFSNYIKSSGARKKQIGYVLSGLFLCTLSITIANLFLPIVGYYEYSIILDSPSSIFIVFFSTLAISKFRLFDLKMLLTEMLVILMGSFLFVLPFLVKDFQIKIFSWFALFLFCIFGYLLIKSTRKELEYKESLENQVEQRTKELKKAKNEAEGKAIALEKAKNEAEKISWQLKDRNNELERFYKLTVGREIKMIELKNEIKSLEAEITGKKQTRNNIAK